VPLCALRRANFRDEVSLTLGNNGKLLSVSYNALVSRLAPKSCDSLEDLSIVNKKKRGGLKYNTRVGYELSTPALSTPPVLPLIKPPKGLILFPKKRAADGTLTGGSSTLVGDQTKQEQESVTGPQSFIRRYWYIIMPLFIYTCFTAPVEDDGSQKQQQQQSNAGRDQQQQQPRQHPSQKDVAKPRLYDNLHSPNSHTSISDNSTTWHITV